MVDFPGRKSQKKQPIPIGVDDYKVLIEGGYLHVDKTLLIKEFWEEGAPVLLITRPRRFGKSIALSMLRYFFEKTAESTSHLFETSKIWQEEGFQKLQGTYPVIYLSFKDVKAKSWELAFEDLKELLSREVRRTLKPLEDLMAKDYKMKYKSLLEKSANEAEFSGCLLFITEVFKECLSKNTIILIDEYDTPITHAYMNGFYDKMTAIPAGDFSRASKIFLS
jgi:hypothetical protein